VLQTFMGHRAGFIVPRLLNPSHTASVETPGFSISWF